MYNPTFELKVLDAKRSVLLTFPVKSEQEGERMALDILAQGVKASHFDIVQSVELATPGEFQTVTYSWSASSAGIRNEGNVTRWTNNKTVYQQLPRMDRVMIIDENGNPVQQKQPRSPFRRR